MATAKKLAQEVGISVREVERSIYSDLFLDEYPRWEPGEPHHLHILQQMFALAETNGQKEHNCAICLGHQQPSSERDANVETPTIDLVGYRTTREKIRTLYNEVYQLKGGPGLVTCDPEMEEEVFQQILDSVKGMPQA